MIDAVRWFLRQPWAGWLVALVLAWALSGSGKTVTVTKTEWREKVITKTEWKVRTEYRQKIVGAPGSKTTMLPDGTVIVEGPVTIENTGTRTGEGSSASERTASGETATTVTPSRPDWTAGLGALLPLRLAVPVFRYEAVVGRRLLGPFWLDGHGIYDPVDGDIFLGLVARAEW